MVSADILAVVALVCFNSKSYIDTLLLVHFEGCKCYFVPLYLCTEGRGRIEGRNGDGRTEGRRAAGGLAGGGTPLSTPRVGTIRGFGMQKFFFEFRVTWNVAAMNEGRVCWLYSLRQSVEFVLIE